MSEPEQSPKKPVLGLSLTQLVGGSAAAATAAVLGARLGTTGTIIGAALVSVVSAVASAIYTASLRRTQEVVAKTKEILPTAQWRTGVVRRDGLEDRGDHTPDDLPEVAELAVEEGVEEATPSVWSRIGWRSVGIAAGAFFVITALLVTGFELVSGRSVEGGSGTTFNRALHGGTPSSSRPTPAPTSRPTSKTSSTPSDTSSPTTSSTPSESASPSATPTPPTPTASPTPTTTPSTSPTASPTR